MPPVPSLQQTSYLVVGKDPGASKVSKAACTGIPTVDTAGLKVTIGMDAMRS